MEFECLIVFSGFAVSLDPKATTVVMAFEVRHNNFSPQDGKEKFHAMQ
jgi:hypothetical protein